MAWLTASRLVTMGVQALTMGAQASVPQPPSPWKLASRARAYVPEKKEPSYVPEKKEPSHKARMDAQSIQKSLQLEDKTSTQSKDMTIESAGSLQKDMTMEALQKDTTMEALQDKMTRVSGEIEELYVTWRGVTPHDEPIKLLEFLLESIGNSKRLFFAFIRKHGDGREIAECMEAMQHPKTQGDQILRLAYVAKINDLQVMNESVLETLKTLHEKHAVRCEHKQALSVHVREMASLLDEWNEGDFKSGMHPCNEYPDGLHVWTMKKLIDRTVMKRDYIKDNAQGQRLWLAACFEGLARAASAALPLLRGAAGL